MSATTVALLPRLLCLAALAVVAGAALAQPQTQPPGWRARFTDPEDGAFDVSEHLLQHRGALPVPIVITEPAVGAGGGAALLYFRESIAGAMAQSRARGEPMAPPDIGGLMAFKTSNGSQGVGGGYFGTLDGDRFRYLAALGRVDLNLDYYGPGDRPRRFALEAPLLLAQGLVRLGTSDWLIGARYLYVGTSARFEGDLPPDVADRALDAHIGRASLVVDLDSRDNLFTPGAGSYVEVDIGVARPGLGSSSSFDSLLARGYHYLPLGRASVLGLRADGKFSSGDVPFYVRPFVSLRGVPALRYQGQHAVVGEVELRHDLNGRWSVLGFAGAGKAYGGRVAWADADTVVAGGAGVRYLIARKLGLYMGLDVARGPEDSVVYLQVGSAWR